MKSLLCWEKHTSSFGRKCNESPLITLPETNRTKATENWWLEDDPGKEPIFRAELLVFGRVLCIISRPQHFQQVICPSVIKYDGDWGWPPFGKRCFNDQSWDIRVDFFFFLPFCHGFFQLPTRHHIWGIPWYFWYIPFQSLIQSTDFF